MSNESSNELSKEEKMALKEDLDRKLSGALQWSEFVNSPESVILLSAYKKVYKILGI